MKDCFVLTFSEDCDIEAVSNSIKTLQNAFPDKTIIGLPEMIHLQNYTKEELINVLEFYIDYMKVLINE